MCAHAETTRQNERSYIIINRVSWLFIIFIHCYNYRISFHDDDVAFIACNNDHGCSSIVLFQFYIYVHHRPQHLVPLLLPKHSIVLFFFFIE